MANEKIIKACQVAAGHKAEHAAVGLGALAEVLDLHFLVIIISLIIAIICFLAVAIATD